MIATIKPIYLELEDLPAVVKLSATTIQREIREGGFPAPRKLSGRRVGWLLREVEEWAESRPVSDLPPPPNTSKRKKPSAQQQSLPDAEKAA